MTLFLVYSGVFTKSVHIPGMPLFFQLICIGTWLIIGHKGPGVECKVHANVNST